jgi:hypothetical protein
MIDKNVNYNDKDFSKHLKGLGLSEKEIKYILGETKRKKFEGGGDGGGGDGGGSSGGDGSSGDGDGSSSGDGGSSGDSSGDSSGEGDSGPGGSDDGSGHGGPGGPGDSGPGGSDDGTGHGGVGSVGPSDDGFGIGPDAAAEAEASNAANAAPTGVMSTVAGFARNAITNAVNNPVATAIGIAMGPVAGFAAQAISNAVNAANRGVTGPSDDTQESASVQSSTQSPSNDGGIGTMQAYAPLYNSPGTSGDSTMDSYIRRLRINLGLPV